MDQQTVIADIEQRAYQARVPINLLCKRAGIHYTTFSRWKKTVRNPDPKGANLHSIGDLYDELDKIDAENAAPKAVVA